MRGLILFFDLLYFFRELLSKKSPVVDGPGRDLAAGGGLGGALPVVSLLFGLAVLVDNAMGNQEGDRVYRDRLNLLVFRNRADNECPADLLYMPEV